MPLSQSSRGAVPHVKFESVSVSFDETAVLKDINLELTEHRIGIIGANGSGKSTLTRLINGLNFPTSGDVLVDGLNVERHAREIRRQVGFIFSDAENQIVMPTVREDVAFSLRRFPLSKREIRSRVDEMLHRFGLDEFADTSPHVLSGGQKQLLALSSVLIMEPSLIIADEPTTLLDLRNRYRLAREFATLKQQLIVVTHDLDFVRDFDRVIVIDRGRIVADSGARDAIQFYLQLMHDSPGDTL